MAESFLEEIYKKSIIVEYLKEAVEFTQRNLLPFAIRTWSEKILPAISEISVEEGMKLPLKEMLSATKSLKNPSLFASIVENEIIPAFLDYLGEFNGIDVSENGYSLKSSKTGFLTLIDESSNMYFHSIYDPMWEAHILAQEVFDPSLSTYVFWGGVGLGYFPYQVYSLSHESVKIVIMESDRTAVEYGVSYGVLSWIPQNDIEIMVGEEKELLEQFFGYGNEKNVRCIITPYRGDEYITKQGAFVAPYMINRDPRVKNRELFSINYRKNMEQGLASVERLSLMKPTNECVIVAAGPSLDENLSFLLSGCEKKIIIAVNTVVRKLIQRGILPDIVVAIDPNDQLLEHIVGVENEVNKVPLVMNIFTNWKYVRNYSGPKFCFKTEDMIDGVCENAKEFPLWNEIGSTVSSAAMEVAYRLGAKKIILIGLDLGYPGGKTYADGAAHLNTIMDEDGHMVGSVDGGLVRTTSVFLQFKIGIERQISKHKDVPVYNMSKHGALIEGCINSD